MAAAGFNTSAPSVFTGENYVIWSVKIRSYLKAYCLREVVETSEDLIQHHANPTLAQIRQFEEDKAKRYKALSSLHSAVSDEIFFRIMHLDSPKEVWDHLKDEFFGSDRTRHIQSLNLSRQFEMLRMEDDENIREFFKRMMSIVNQLRLLGKAVTEEKLVHKILVSLPEKYESKISSLEDSRDITQMTMKELVNVLEGLKQRRVFRQRGVVDSALVA
ncbi:PREDICTED: uncharacterized protein LOC18586780 [Theobroma cacao]|uniref:Uncharacterized protein LOC18586780 n=1 Tax=Theobroma cacao TaxID=3641 RepID=A0AB32X1Q7_THECC|nr:PREDICTED: uncharacterized protein LOC18586780 [Theobroma cacao]